MIALQRRLARLETSVPIAIAPVEMEPVYAAIRLAITGQGVVQGQDDSFASCWARSLGCSSSELTQVLRDRARA
ncbi:MAG: hypothetical protein M3Y27_08935 [Acidobacteriota bacterium]|nr:hypothetical protein [Acidobacteriota bacterium]